MRVDIEGGKYTYIFEDGRARLLRYGEPSRRDVVGDKLIYCMAAEISELRQQLASAQERIEGVKEQRDVERAAYLNEFEKNQVIVAEKARLRQQLDAAKVEVAHVKEVEFPRKVRVVAENWRKKLEAKQAEVDALMLEYCPSEMSQEQLDNWAAHQQPVKE